MQIINLRTMCFNEKKLTDFMDLDLRPQGVTNLNLIKIQKYLQGIVMH